MPLRVLFITKELIAANLAYRMKNEGCEVRLFIENEQDRGCFDGLVEKTNDWQRELDWVGKDGLIVFDDVEYGAIQDKLRQDGFKVVGGSGDGDKLELDRVYGQTVMSQCGIAFPAKFVTQNHSILTAIEKIRTEKGQWVIKQTGHNSALTYVSEFTDGSDAISVLTKLRDTLGQNTQISLQKRVMGIEIAVGRFFNGLDWVGPIVINREHKHFNSNNIGPLGGETGTIMYYETNENCRLFTETLSKLKTHLQKSSYRGYIDINCIVEDERTVYPLEITSRFGSSTNELQAEIHQSYWSDFLYALATGSHFNLAYQRGWGINVALTVSPFPYLVSHPELSQKGVGIYFDAATTSEDMQHIHFEEVAVNLVGGQREYVIAGETGYVLYVTAVAKSIDEARQKAYSLIEKIHIPRMFYRNDIGINFQEKEYPVLKQWNWL